MVEVCQDFEKYRKYSVIVSSLKDEHQVWNTTSKQQLATEKMEKSLQIEFRT